MNFGTKIVFITCFNSYNSNCIDIGTNFGTKLVFWLKIQIIIHPIFPKLTVKIQIIAEHTQLPHVGTAANYKVLHNHISAQLLLSKHRKSKGLQVLKANQFTSQRYLKNQSSNRILGIYPFSRFTCRRKIRNDKNLSCQDPRDKVKNCKIRPEKARSSCQFTKI